MVSKCKCLILATLQSLKIKLKIVTQDHKTIISSIGIFVAIANIVWVKIMIFLLCQKSLGY